MPLIDTGLTQSDLLDEIAHEYISRYIQPEDVTIAMISARLGINENRAAFEFERWAAKPGYQKVKLLNPETGKYIRALRKSQ